MVVVAVHFVAIRAEGPAARPAKGNALGYEGHRNPLRAEGPSGPFRRNGPTRDSHSHTYRSSIVCYVAQHTEHLFANLGVLKVGATPFGAERDVQPDSSERLRHGLSPVGGLTCGKTIGPSCRRNPIYWREADGSRANPPTRRASAPWCPAFAEDRLGLRPDPGGGGGRTTRALPFAGQSAGPSARRLKAIADRGNEVMPYVHNL